MAADPPVLDYFPSRFSIIQNYKTDEQLSSEGLAEINIHPFQLMKVEDDAIIVAPGTINNHYAGPAGRITCNVGTSLSFLVLDVNAGTGGVSNASLDVKSSAPDGFSFSKNNVPGSFEVLIAAFSSGERYQLVSHNLTATVKLAHTQIKQSISLGEYDSDLYYQWEVT